MPVAVEDPARRDIERAGGDQRGAAVGVAAGKRQRAGTGRWSARRTRRMAPLTRARALVESGLSMATIVRLPPARSMPFWKSTTLSDVAEPSTRLLPAGTKFALPQAIVPVPPLRRTTSGPPWAANPPLPVHCMLPADCADRGGQRAAGFQHRRGAAAAAEGQQGAGRVGRGAALNVQRAVLQRDAGRPAQRIAAGDEQSSGSDQKARARRRIRGEGGQRQVPGALLGEGQRRRCRNRH